MCGIAGFTLPAGLPPERAAGEAAPRLGALVGALRHRGPDARATHVEEGIALGHARLAIVDLEGGAQPMRDPATGAVLVFNGEIFNHVELRAELAPYFFRTRSDTEVLLAAWLRWGPDCLPRLNGQFAFALWDPRERDLWLVRDRFGILPLHHARTGDGLAFASEARALVAAGFAPGRLDPAGVKQTLQLWAPVPPRTCVEGVSQLAPGTLARFRDGRLTERRWWHLDLGRPPEPLRPGEAAEALGAALDDAVRLRLRADVPVAAYLSGGLDSSIVSALAQRALSGTLSTFSVAFADPRYDERTWQEQVAAALGTRHRVTLAGDAEIAALFPEAVRHAEHVLVRSAPAPLLRLSRAVREAGGKVVLTGEGSDEVLLGYDLYAEARVRGFWARRPGSAVRPALLRRLHPYLPLGGQGDAVLRSTFGVGLADPSAPAFSHLVRWAASARLWRLLDPAAAAALAGEDPVESLLATVPAAVRGWRPLARAQHLEMATLLAGNLLAPQGDRMLMASSVEGRFPFLDHRVVELAARLPEGEKLRGLTGKWALRRFARGLLPPSVADRPKFPYRAPPPRLLVGDAAPEWARAALAPEAIRAAGLFDPDKVGKLAAKLARGLGPTSEVDAMGITAVLSGQLLAAELAALSRPGAREAVA